MDPRFRLRFNRMQLYPFQINVLPRLPLRDQDLILARICSGCALAYVSFACASSHVPGTNFIFTCAWHH